MSTAKRPISTDETDATPRVDAGRTALQESDPALRLARGRYTADIVTVDTGSIGLTPAVSEPLRTVVPNLVYSATGADVRDVFVDGNPVVREGEFVDIDPRAAVEEASERAARVFRAGATDWREAGSELVARVDEGWL